MTRISLDHCVIKVSDFARSDAFYERVFGAEVLPLMDQFHVYRIGDQQLNVHGPALEGSPDLLARLPVAAGNSDLCFEWHGPIDDAVAHLEACQVTVDVGPTDTFGARGKGRSVYFRDPDGSLLEFITYAADKVGRD
jgi:catechol 2,3-dioxygenase-like lactoylglutathione lyase family enzyme